MNSEQYINEVGTLFMSKSNMTSIVTYLKSNFSLSHVESMYFDQKIHSFLNDCMIKYAEYIVPNGMHLYRQRVNLVDAVCQINSNFIEYIKNNEEFVSHLKDIMMPPRKADYIHHITKQSEENDNMDRLVVKMDVETSHTSEGERPHQEEEIQKVNHVQTQPSQFIIYKNIVCDADPFDNVFMINNNAFIDSIQEPWTLVNIFVPIKSFHPFNDFSHFIKIDGCIIPLEDLISRSFEGLSDFIQSFNFALEEAKFPFIKLIKMNEKSKLTIHDQRSSSPIHPTIKLEMNPLLKMYLGFKEDLLYLQGSTYIHAQNPFHVFWLPAKLWYLTITSMDEPTLKIVDDLKIIGTFIKGNGVLFSNVNLDLNFINEAQNIEIIDMITEKNIKEYNKDIDSITIDVKIKTTLSTLKSKQ